MVAASGESIMSEITMSEIADYIDWQAYATNEWHNHRTFSATLMSYFNLLLEHEWAMNDPAASDPIATVKIYAAPSENSTMIDHIASDCGDLVEVVSPYRPYTRPEPYDSFLDYHDNGPANPPAKLKVYSLHGKEFFIVRTVHSMVNNGCSTIGWIPIGLTVKSQLRIN